MKNALGASNGGLGGKRSDEPPRRAAFYFVEQFGGCAGKVQQTSIGIPVSTSNVRRGLSANLVNKAARKILSDVAGLTNVQLLGALTEGLEDQTPQIEFFDGFSCNSLVVSVLRALGIESGGWKNL
jgi:hypothetical protein